jgi:ribonuclease HI
VLSSLVSPSQLLLLEQGQRRNSKNFFIPTKVFKMDPPSNSLLTRIRSPAYIPKPQDDDVSDDLMDLQLYTDGSCHPTNPGPGGYAFLLLLNKAGVEVELASDARFGGNNTTNNIMEMKAVILGLTHVLTTYPNQKAKPTVTAIEVFSDSTYVVKGITLWVHNWKKNQWKTAKKQPVANQELWQELDDVVTSAKAQFPIVKFTWVKGHSDNLYNQKVDQLASKAAENSTSLGQRTIIPK